SPPPGAGVPGRLGGWRNLPSGPAVKSYEVRDGSGAARHVEVRYRTLRDGWAVEGAVASAVGYAAAREDAGDAGPGPGGGADGDVDGGPGRGGGQVLAVTPGHVTFELDGVVRHFDVSTYPADARAHPRGGREAGGPGGPGPDTAGTREDDGERIVYVDCAGLGSYRLRALPRFADPRDRAEPGSLLAPMPGTVVRVAEGIAEGAVVAAGDPLLWLEAMKMEHRVTAPAAGRLALLRAVPGQQVETGAVLAVLSPLEGAAEAARAVVGSGGSRGGPGGPEPDTAPAPAPGGPHD
ncbi:acetyl-CoA carboxylase biotin carboxyl carrier protein subunit, partial [Streptomyces fuscigenes]|uniref:acetyl-CoA carboxylase biotin carboxyl carrier protein subunit n=1 Tax=Streptomyces fuscigenes TaxID=1528880 RepID=UPI001F3D2BAB